MRNSLLRLISTVSCGLSVMALFTIPMQAQVAEGAGQVMVSGKQLIRDGGPWIPHGFYQIPFEVPPAAFATELSFWQSAYQGYSPDEYPEMVKQGADSVRLQIAQNGADPENKKFFDPQWLQQAIGAIHAARAAGLTVIVSIQDETQTGVAQQAPLPNAATRRVWRELAPIFGQDRGVLLELYNEPSPGNGTPDRAPTALEWQNWAAAMNETIALVRALGAVNVVVVDGLGGGQQLSGAPSLDDPLNQVLYASHPYVFAAKDQSPQTWDEKFGDFSQNHPVIISEWGIGFYCDANTPASVVTFLQYLQDHGIGLEAGQWDWAPLTFRSLIQGFPNGQFSSFFGPSGLPLACNAPFNWPGKTVESWYLNGVPPTSPQ